MELRNKKWSEEYFFKARNEILRYNIKDTVDYLKKVPDYRNFSKKLMIAKEDCITLIQPGIPNVPEEQVGLLKYLQDEGKPDLLLVNIRNNAVQNENNRSPNLKYFIEECKEICESIDLPLQVTYSTLNCKLLTEVIYSCGFTSSQGGAISHNILDVKNVPIEKSILDWQYCDRLVGFYEEQGISINRETFGIVDYNTLIPPSISNAISIIEGLLAAEQGVKNITVGVRQGGNLIQDVASIKALEEQIGEYMKDYGYKDVYITTAFHQCMLESSEDEGKTFGIISVGTITAILAGATKVVIKTSKLTKEVNSAIIRAAKMPVNILGGQRLAASKELETEIVIIKAEVKCILDKVLELGKGDLAIGVVRAFENGVIDIPVASGRYNTGEMVSARDNTGAIRYMKFGNIPFTQELKNFNRKKMENKNIKNKF
ncbi:methylaspartate mutase subunit E [Clostridium sp. BJN0013]|uniref:methylaspartate mutase subunit E n=1 Tax=Clostridium sp. BJN0013 TaxID=3236840 RepID=UPI0034C6838F